jgi:hypothetical protein
VGVDRPLLPGMVGQIHSMCALLLFLIHPNAAVGVPLELWLC